MLTVVASVVYLEINPNILEDFKNTVINNGEILHLNQWSSYAVFTVTIFGLLLLITTVLKYVMSNFRIANINLGDKASISKKEEKESIFDKSLDEIVYFFESTTYDTVFIEDLDRFNQPNIFIKLRELNTVINNYDNIKRNEDDLSSPPSPFTDFVGVENAANDMDKYFVLGYFSRYVFITLLFPDPYGPDNAIFFTSLFFTAQ